MLLTLDKEPEAARTLQQAHGSGGSSEPCAGALDRRCCRLREVMPYDLGEGRKLRVGGVLWIEARYRRLVLHEVCM